jgi:predicted ATP-grasp superfamily ATP-dependent carboligase
VSAVGVVGASARAAVMSLARAGFSAWAVDLFADRDLRRLAPSARCPADRYPDALPELAAAFPPGPVLYTGGLENHPEVVRRLAEARPLWGNPPDVLERARDPLLIADTLHGEGFGYPRVLPADSPPPAVGSWLRKPRSGAGGSGIRLATPAERPDSRFYFQEFIPGRAMSAVFASTRARTTLLGVTEQLIGESWLHTRPFRYAGNIGPVPLTSELASELTLLGYRLSKRAHVRGLWGVDFILHEDRPVVVEVNPRYTASVEVIEHSCHSALPKYHAAAFGNPPGVLPRSRRPQQVIGKAIYYAPHCLTLPESGPWDADLAGDPDPWRLPGFADIPDPGEVVEPGHPVLTFFATGHTPMECRERLQSRAAELDRFFAGTMS